MKYYLVLLVLFAILIIICFLKIRERRKEKIGVGNLKKHHGGIGMITNNKYLGDFVIANFAKKGIEVVDVDKKNQSTAILGLTTYELQNNMYFYEKYEYTFRVDKKEVLRSTYIYTPQKGLYTHEIFVFVADEIVHNALLAVATKLWCDINFHLLVPCEIRKKRINSQGTF